MRNFLSLILFIGVAFSARAIAQTSAAPQQLLEAADAMRNPIGDFSEQVDLTEYRARKEVAASTMTVFSKPVPGSGQYNNLVRFDRPLRDAGKLLLRSGKDIWFYDPASGSSIRISPQARLLGQASNGDVMSTNMAADYRAKLVANEVIKNAAEIQVECAHLRLEALSDTVTYPAVDYWIDLVNQRPVKAEFRTADGRLLKTAYFRRFERELGVDRPTETVIIDALDPGWITVMRTSKYEKRDIPESWLQRDYLARFGNNAN